jgi:RHS repeat-associated protein
VEKTVNGNTVNYVYDGAQAIAEVTGGAVSATILTGLNLDEVLARYAASGNRTYLTDALNTVIAQANDTQAIENYYTYTPYGETQTLGPDGGNPIQYTARENDQTGLYYYRARYYDPVLKVFYAEDPIGLRGGGNVRAYVGGDPVNRRDPLGLVQWSGTVTSANVGKNQEDHYTLTSECIGGRQTTVEVAVTSASAGGGISWIESTANFSDSFSYINPMVFAGPANNVSFAIAAGAGTVFSFTTLGGATSPGGWSLATGGGLSAGVSFGFSRVLSEKSRTCSCPF